MDIDTANGLFQKDKLIVVLFGFLMGVVVSIGIKYPVNLEKINSYKAICGGSDIIKAKVGITGKIYEIDCANHSTFTVK